MSSPFLIGSLKQLTGYRQYLFGCYTEMVTSRRLVDRYFSMRSYRSMILVMMQRINSETIQYVLDNSVQRFLRRGSGVCLSGCHLFVFLSTIPILTFAPIAVTGTV